MLTFDNFEFATTNQNIVSLPANARNVRITSGEVHFGSDYSYVLPTGINTNGNVWMFISYQQGTIRGGTTDNNFVRPCSGFIVIEYTKTTD